MEIESHLENVEMDERIDMHIDKDIVESNKEDSQTCLDPCPNYGEGDMNIMKEYISC